MQRLELHSLHRRLLMAGLLCTHPPEASDARPAETRPLIREMFQKLDQALYRELCQPEERVKEEL